jgi:hypothetical protein
MPSDPNPKAPYAGDNPKPWRRWLWLIGFVPFAVMFGYRQFMTLTAESRVREVCAELTPGMSVESIAKFADARGMYPPDRYSNGYFIGDKATSNWYNCHLDLRDGALLGATYFDFGKRK